MKKLGSLLCLFLVILFVSHIRTDDVETKEQVGEQQHYETHEDHDAKSKFFIILAITSTFASEWEHQMSDYEPDYVYMIPLAYKTREHYFENITHVPARMRGAFLTDDEKKDQIEFEIVGPNNEVVYHNTTNECIFDLSLTHPGRYMIVFNNRFVNSDIKVTFTMNTGQNPMLKKEDLSFSDQKLDSLLNFIKKFDLEFKFSRTVHLERYRKIQKTNKYFYTFSVIETIVLVCISMWQFYYMRQLFEIKALI